jgi:hypothetical protein
MRAESHDRLSIANGCSRDVVLSHVSAIQKHVFHPKSIPKKGLSMIAIRVTFSRACARARKKKSDIICARKCAQMRARESEEEMKKKCVF